MDRAANLDDSRPPDGRTARGVRTRDAIVDACIALVEAGDLWPTAPRIAEAASVSVRSVFQHFADLETLFAAVGQRVIERLAGVVEPIDPTRGLLERIELLIGQRAQIFEAVTPVRRAAMMHAQRSAEITRLFQEGHHLLTAQVAEVFAPDLGAVEDRAEILHSLDVVLAWSTWDTLRTLEHRTPDEARRILHRLVAGVLRPAGDGGEHREGDGAGVR